MIMTHHDWSVAKIGTKSGARSDERGLIGEVSISLERSSISTQERKKES